MRPSLQTGLATTGRIVVDPPRTIGFMGDEGRVYATPELVRDIEMTCRALLLSHLDPGEDSVGVRIELDHLAATPLGLWVDITATIVEVDGRRVSFEVTARDPVDQIARCMHIRFVANTAKSIERIRAKLAAAPK
ncbi:MAG: LysR family transcriptional regulator [Gemmatimonadetes bacterium]|nr:LysR family transcriptional regulator [Gemmatimonadota bacterium]